ncbi:MAG: cofactor-independent phosphoglycerate mutase, partial [Bacteroidaceae bacterium]|nr:cofactor-independent phosphoglycerate mutase [Bacteroidaceae bacterium]
GMADWKVKELGDKTLLQYANTPYMDLLAKNGRVGRLKTVADGFHPGSEVANSSILGYDQSKVYEGRGPLEAASIGVELAPDDMAIRCNLICIENGNIKNHSCGRLETEEADVLIKFLQEKLGSERVHFYTGIQYRHLLVIKGGNKHLKCTPPHDVPGQPFMPLLVKPEIPEAKETADLINDLILKSQKLLADHPFNKQRVVEGKDPANSIWPWAGGYRPNMTPLTVTYPQIKRGAVITAVDLIRGIGRLAGLRCINVEGATGLFDTNYEGKAQAAIEALKTDDFVYLHVEASDEAGHDGNLKLKLQTIEDLDRRLIGPIYEAVKNFDEPVSIAVLPDHPTPVALRTHTNEPIPFLIYYPGIEADSVQTFDEIAAVDGSYGLFEGDGFINEFMNN